MKLKEMADLLSGLADTMEKALSKSGRNDLHAVSDCFRQFGDENVTTFCKFIHNAKQGKTNSAPRKSSSNGAKVDDWVRRVQHFLDHQNEYEFPQVRQMAADIGKLTVREMKEIGNRIGCPVIGKKSAMVSQLADWLVNIKLSSNQNTFSLTGSDSN